MRVGAEIFTVAHAYPERIVELHFFALRAARASRGRCSGRRCAGWRASELRSLEFPPADAELIDVLSDPQTPQVRRDLGTGVQSQPRTADDGP